MKMFINLFNLKRDDKTIFVNNLNYELSDREIEQFFKKFGAILLVL
jgi:RNA recognition motif-containing protein